MAGPDSDQQGTESSNTAMDTSPESTVPTTAPPTNATSTTAEPQQQQLEDIQAPQDASAPASPPLPQRHTAVTPGPRAARFIEMYEGALRRTLSRVGYENFASCFPTVATYAPNALRNVQKQMVDYLEDRCNKDFQSILEERDVIRKLNELETLLSEAEARRKDAPEDAPTPTPPHTLPPEQVIKAHLHPHLAHHHSQLSAALANTKLENEALFADVQAQRAEMESLLAALDRSVADVDGANGLLAEVADDLAAESREADTAMAGT